MYGTLNETPEAGVPEVILPINILFAQANVLIIPRILYVSDFTLLENWSPVEAAFVLTAFSTDCSVIVEVAAGAFQLASTIYLPLVGATGALLVSI